MIQHLIQFTEGMRIILVDINVLWFHTSRSRSDLTVNKHMEQNSSLVCFPALDCATELHSPRRPTAFEVGSFPHKA